jgi:hypothetical protein
MSKLIVLVMVIALTLAPAATPEALAQDDGRAKLAARVMEVMELRTMIDAQFDLIQKMQLDIATKLAQQSGVSADAIAKSDSFAKALNDLIRKELSFEALAHDVTKVYAEAFTEEELRGLIVFYEGPVGRALVKKTPELTAQMASLAQARMVAVFPKIQALLQQMKPQ